MGRLVYFSRLGMSECSREPCLEAHPSWHGAMSSGHSRRMSPGPTRIGHAEAGFWLCGGVRRVLIRLDDSRQPYVDDRHLVDCPRQAVFAMVLESSRVCVLAEGVRLPVDCLMPRVVYGVGRSGENLRRPRSGAVSLAACMPLLPVHDSGWYSR